MFVFISISALFIYFTPNFYLNVFFHLYVGAATGEVGEEENQNKVNLVVEDEREEMPEPDTNGAIPDNSTCKIEEALILCLSFICLRHACDI